MAKKQIVVVYVSSIGSSTQYVTEKNYKDTETIFNAAWDDIEKQQSDVGEIWIDSAWVENIESPGDVNWKDIITDKKGQLDPTMIEKIFDDDEFGIKAGFIINGYGNLNSDILDKYMDEIIVYDAKRDNWEEGNYDTEYPEGWLEDYCEETFPDLAKALEKNEGQSYFDWARLVSDQEINGGLECKKMGDYFVYMLGIW
jgi:hypothetical protein